MCELQCRCISLIPAAGARTEDYCRHRTAPRRSTSCAATQIMPDLVSELQETALVARPGTIVMTGRELQKIVGGTKPC